MTDGYDLSWACETNDLNAVKRLVPLVCKNSPLLDIYNVYTDETILGCAAHYGSPEIVKFLIENGAEPDYKALPYSNTPLALIICLGPVKDSLNQKRLLENAAILLDYGADLNVYTRQNNSLLVECINKNYIEAAQLLMEYGADIYAQHGADDISPLAYAQKHGSRKMNRLFKDWDRKLQDGTAVIKKPTFDGKGPPPAPMTKETYLTLSGDEICNRLMTNEGLDEVRQLFADNFEPLPKCLGQAKAMWLYVHIYKKLSQDEKASYEKGVKALHQHSKLMLNLLKEQQAER